MRIEQKKLAIKLRRQGKTYREILAQVPIAKSTLSDWLRSVELARPQVQRITELRRQSALRGAHRRRDMRLAEVNSLLEQGCKDVGLLSDREVWLIGTALHWAEGSKQRESSRSTGIIFTNSDSSMLAFFLKWLEAVGVEKKNIRFELYVHENRIDEVSKFKRWWAKQLAIKSTDFGAVYMKKDKINTNRKNITDLYHGLIRIRVHSSTALNRRVNGWIEGIVRQ